MTQKPFRDAREDPRATKGEGWKKPGIHILGSQAIACESVSPPALRSIGRRGMKMNRACPNLRGLAAAVGHFSPPHHCYPLVNWESFPTLAGPLEGIREGEGAVS